MRNYYEILGVSTTATEDEIKTAYRKLSKKWHPDAHATDSDEERKAAEDKFKEIAEAYSVLSDKEKRNRYDNGGGATGFDFDINEFMRNMGVNFGFNPFGARAQHVGEDIYMNINLTFAESYSGCKKEITYEREIPCTSCNGTGSADGKINKCPHCNGTGTVIVRQNANGNSWSIVTGECQHCHGTGKAIMTPCKECNGTGLKKTIEKEALTIPAGIFSGARLVLKHKGSLPSEGGMAGNLIVIISVENDDYFVRVPNSTDVLHYEKVPFTDALLGCEKEIRFPDGTTKSIKFDACTKDGQSFIQAGKGFADARFGNNAQKGDYSIIVQYIYPNKLSDKQKELLKNFNDC